METTVTIPAPLFESAERMAQQLGLSRSELYTAALGAYIRSLQESETTRALDEIYSQEPSAPDPVLMQIQAASLSAEDW